MCSCLRALEMCSIKLLLCINYFRIRFPVMFFKLASEFEKVIKFQTFRDTKWSKGRGEGML